MKTALWLWTIRNAFDRSPATLDELGDAQVLAAQPISTERGSCCTARQDPRISEMLAVAQPVKISNPVK